MMENFQVHSNTGIAKLAYVVFSALLLVSLTSCAQNKQAESKSGEVKIDVVAEGLDHPWGMDFLPDGRLLVSERSGTLRMLNMDSSLSAALEGIPKVAASGQGGLLDVAISPDFESSRLVYFS